MCRFCCVFVIAFITEMDEIMMNRRNPRHPDGKKTISFKMFVVPIAIFLVSVPYLAKKNLPLMFVILASLAITLILASLGLLYASLKANRYIQKHDFQLWKKIKSHSLKDRMEAGKAMSSIYMQVPCLAKPLELANNIAFVLLTIWTIGFILILSLIIFTGA
jgi:hypothetical protein